MAQILKAFSVFDVKADAYSPPFFVATNGLAVRQFQDLVNDRNTVPGRYPGDFKLVCIGAFNPGTGELKSAVEAESLGFGSDFVTREFPPPTNAAELRRAGGAS